MYQTIAIIIFCLGILVLLDKSFFRELLLTPIERFKELRSPRRAQSLAEECMLLMSGPIQLSTKFELTRYSFYTDIIEALIRNSLKHGAPIKKYMAPLRGSILKSALFDKRINSLVVSSVLQMVCCAFFVWLFQMVCKLWFNIKLSPTLNIVMWGYQILGLIAFILIGIKIYKKIIYPLYELLKTTYTIHSLSQSTMGITQVLENSGLKTITEGTRYKAYVRELNSIINSRLKKGLSPVELLEGLLSNLWLELEISLDQFQKQLTLLKFSVLCFVFLPAYFSGVYSIFEGLI